MAQHRHTFPILKMSKVFGVSASGYYRWLNRPPSARARQNRQLMQAIRHAWSASRGMYGAPRIHKVLIKQGLKTSVPRVARLMAHMGIKSQIRKTWRRSSSGHSYPVAPNLLARRFNPTQLNQVWVSDITYLPSQTGWLYLTTVMDLADRQIIGWALSEDLSAQHTSLAALAQAVCRRGSPSNLLFHSDQGVQYACSEFTTMLKANGFRQSMSRRGNCWDNAPAESFFKTLKHELSIATPFEHYQQARTRMFEFIELWYNRKRLHSALNYQTPVQVEQQLNHQHAA